MPGDKQYLRGTHRAATPEDTLARLLPLLPEFGITRIANVTGLDRIGLPVVMVVRPNSRSVAVSQGKGQDLSAAKVSGVMEAIETWHAERMTNPLRLVSHRELAQELPVVDIARLPEIDGGQFHRDAPMLWVEGVNLLDGTPRWVPYEMVHTNYTVPRPTGHGCFPASSNGLASGNTLIEAQIHAICEVVERDASTLWAHMTAEMRDARLLDPASVDDPECREIIDQLIAANLRLAIWDTRTDIGTPCFHCYLQDSGADRGHLGAGAGCHPAKEIALSRALTEAVQTRTTYIAGSRDDLSPEEFSAAGRDAKYAYADRMGANAAPALDYRGLPVVAPQGFQEDLDQLLARLRRAGIEEVVSVDMTRPQYDIAVVRIVVPGLEAPHDDETFLPGPRVAGMRKRARP